MTNDGKTGPKPPINLFGFLDESGHLKTPRPDRVFGLGLLKLSHPSSLHKEIIRFKQKNSFFGEFKFTSINNSNLKHYKKLIDMYFSVPYTYFSVMIFDKEKIDLKAFHNNNAFVAYNAFMARLIAESLGAGEYMAAIADDVTTPKDDQFEKQVKHKVKRRLRRNALFGIVRAESHAFCELQMVDVLLGAVCYAFKIKYGLISANNTSPKLKIVKHIQKHLNVQAVSVATDRRMRSGRVFKVKEFVGQIQK